MITRLVLATANPDKAREIMAALADLAVEVVARPDAVPEVDETGETLEANARLKAVAVGAATGDFVLADDTGLEVDALGGAPGVHSARYAGVDATYADNVKKLVAEMTRAKRAARTARFRTVLVVSGPDGREIVAHGIAEGVIADEPRGTHGFGYDSVFIPVGGGGRTFAEMDLTEKQRLSHRGAALRVLVQKLRDTDESR